MHYVQASPNKVHNQHAYSYLKLHLTYHTLGAYYRATSHMCEANPRENDKMKRSAVYGPLWDFSVFNEELIRCVFLQ